MEEIISEHVTVMAVRVHKEMDMHQHRNNSYRPAQKI